MASNESSITDVSLLLLDESKSENLYKNLYDSLQTEKSKPKPKITESTILIIPEYQGNGYGREALKLVINYGFKDLSLDGICCSIFCDNYPSLRLHENLGFLIYSKINEEEYIMYLKKQNL